MSSVLARVLQRNRTEESSTDFHERTYYGIWLTWIWGQRCPTICPQSLEAQESLINCIWVCRSQSQRSQSNNSQSETQADKHLAPRGSRSKNQKFFCPREEMVQEERILPFSMIFSIHVVSRLDDFNPHDDCGSFLFNLLIHMLVSSGNIVSPLICGFIFHGVSYL